MDLNYQGKTRSSLHSRSGKIRGFAQGIPRDIASWYCSPTVLIHGKLQSIQGLKSFRNEGLGHYHASEKLLTQLRHWQRRRATWCGRREKRVTMPVRPCHHLQKRSMQRICFCSSFSSSLFLHVSTRRALLGLKC